MNVQGEEGNLEKFFYIYLMLHLSFLHISTLGIYRNLKQVIY